MSDMNAPLDHVLRSRCDDGKQPAEPISWAATIHRGSKKRRHRYIFFR